MVLNISSSSIDKYSVEAPRPRTRPKMTRRDRFFHSIIHNNRVSPTPTEFVPFPPGARMSPAPGARVSPTPVDRMSPVPVARVSPVPVARVSPVPVARMSPVPVARVSPVPVDRMSPTPGARVSPAPGARVSPIPVQPVREKPFFTRLFNLISPPPVDQNTIIPINVNDDDMNISTSEKNSSFW